MEKIKVVSERCKSCGYCVKFCPKQVLAIGEKVNLKGYEYVEPVNLEDCISCCVCARICPDGAIEVYK
ncbi:ferredoxin family protein [Metaclostridioides mangenotii]|uniref:4Fe-4S dicluster domain-containing protein n=1 Tax=Metaclostridioides mangenotii TaxID=1540 RepID=UPI0028E2F62F|nr:ferredoxin family protein [Clostridioides mangenotii]